MMTTLLQRCEQVATKVDQLTLSLRHASEQKQVQERTKEWKTRREKLRAIATRVACLGLDAQVDTVANRRSALRHNAAEALERLKSPNGISDLTSDASWMRLLASVEGLAEALEDEGKAAWKAFLAEQGALEAPDLLRGRAPSTPMNEASLMAYRTSHGVYSSLVRMALPRSKDDLVQLSESIAACRAAAAKLDYDVPPEVERFFRAVQAGTASLILVTPDVLKWLADNGQLDRYMVSSA